MSDDLNEYERQRQANIAANSALLAQLGIQQPSKPSSSSSSAGSKRAASATAAKKAPREKKAKVERAAVEGVSTRRASARLQGVKADSETLREREEQQLKEQLAMKEAKRRATHGPYSLDNLPEPIPPADLDALASTLKGASTSSSAAGTTSAGLARGRATADGEDPSGTKASVAQLRAAFQGLAIRKHTKVTLDRVFSMAVHPDPAKTLVFVGDKSGQLGIWDALATRDEGGDGTEEVEDEEDEDDNSGKHWRIQAHGRSSISCIKVSPSDHSKLLTSSYDCTIRQLDLASQKSHEVFSLADDDCLISNFDMTPDGRGLWASDKHGGVSFADLREKPSGKARRWEVGEGLKLGAISVNPTLPWLVLTAGNDRTCRIWDTRLLQSLPLPAETLAPSADQPQTFPLGHVPSDEIVAYRSEKKGKALLRGLYKHDKSCSSAYWDPWGKRVLTTSYDDHVRVWDVGTKPFGEQRPLTAAEFGEPDVTIAHDCQTGRWLSILRAQWSQYTQLGGFFTVGSMRRSLDVFAATGEPLARLFDPDIITAVPAVTAAHPGVVNHVVGGNGSGKCYLWAPPAEEAAAAAGESEAAA